MKNTRYTWVQDSPRRYSANIGPLSIGVVRIAKGPLNGLWCIDHIFGDEGAGPKNASVLQVAMLNAEDTAMNLLVKTFTFLARR